MNKYIIGTILCISFSNCVSTYYPIQIGYIPINDFSYSLEESNVEISIDYDVLIVAGQKRYAKIAKKNNVSIIVISVQNSGQRKLILPRDLLIHTISGDSIQPLEIGPAMGKLLPPQEQNNQSSGLNVDAPPVYGMIWQGGKAANEAKKMISTVQFSKDMAEHYLQDRIIDAGQQTRGFLVLPVKKGTPLKISLR